MEHHNISKLLNDSTVSKSVTRKWIEVNDLTSSQYSANKNIRFKNSILGSDLYDQNDAFIIEKGAIAIEGTNNVKKRNKKLTFRNKVPFKSCMSKINDTVIDNAQEFDNVM